MAQSNVLNINHINNLELTKAIALTKETAKLIEPEKIVGYVLCTKLLNIIDRRQKALRKLVDALFELDSEKDTLKFGTCTITRTLTNEGVEQLDQDATLKVLESKKLRKQKAMSWMFDADKVRKLHESGEITDAEYAACKVQAKAKYRVTVDAPPAEVQKFTDFVLEL